MARLKARSLEPQYVGDSVGAYYGKPKEDILAGSIVVVTDLASSYFVVEKATNQSIRKSSGLLYIAKHASDAGRTMLLAPVHILPYAGDKKLKDGEAVWLGRNGEWTFNQPKQRAIQVGRVLGSGDSVNILLAPQGRY
tara:strand:- start:1182 stop:1595 length:414 start_codon:yes stop_codon:yes gene_type:complete